jgi:hypothetical protein
MTQAVTWSIKNLTGWNENRRGEIDLDAVARVFLGDPQITDRDRFAFALRELRKRGYDVEACPVDWTKWLMICSVVDSKWMSFGITRPSKLYERLAEIARHSRLMNGNESECLFTELYPDAALFDQNDSLEEPYEFSFKGDPALVEGVFQAVGFATQHGLMVPDDGSEPDYHLGVAPARMVMV